MSEPGEPNRSALLEPEERLRRQADEVLRLFGEFLRRLSHEGVRGVEELAQLHARVCRATGTIALAELDFALSQIGDLADRLRLLGDRLAKLGAMKRRLDAVALAEPAAGDPEESN